MNQLTEARRPLLALDNVLEQGFLVFNVFWIEWLLDTREYEFRRAMEGAIRVINRSRGRLLVQEGFLTKI